MEDGAKEDPAQSKEPKFLGKAGWVKKAPGRLLASYKDRYIHVEKTEIVVYENEDLQNCLERLDLENYDHCHELKSPFKKKHRLILIRSSKPGNKVHDVKFQAASAEEKDAWIKALLDGINRAKNKIFDEVTVDESSNLEHVTRSRPKGNRNRRPPTRIHMKEIADVSSDGILRLDLDLEDATIPNGTHHATVDGTGAPKAAPTPPSNASEAAEKQTGGAEEEAKTEPEVSPQKKVLKPPMPPTKEAKPSTTPEDEPDKDEAPEKKVLKPPMPPSKEAKPCASPVEEATEEDKAEKVAEKSPDARKKTVPPPAPPNKPSSSGSISNLVEASQSRPNSPPTPPSKEKKPSHPTVEPDQEVQDTADENEEKEEGDKKEATGEAVETDEATPSVKDDKPESPSEEGEVSEEESGESSGVNEASDSEPQIPAEPIRKSPSPLLTPKKKPEKPVEPDRQHTDDNTTVMQTNEGQDPTASLQTASDTSASSPQAEEAPPKSEPPSVVVSLDDSLSLSPLICHLPEEKKKKTEEKSVDSGQHSDDDSEGSGTEDTLATSTAALRGSHPSLDVLDTSEDDVQIPVSIRLTKVPPKPQVRPKVFPFRRSHPTPPLKPSVKARSASSGDLLSDSSVCIQVTQHSTPVAGGDRPPSIDVMKLETEVALEMEKTKELLSQVSQSEEGGDAEGMPQDLLAQAMEKLQKADDVLREVNKLKIAKSPCNRKSW
ncbi:muscle M-line assembly protein unc-89 isoform X2 [Epinephelus moara]|uniref:muscle M-line assembly protein unc-89 isoform X2 n=1 Tax=Epinephelus moara TaxID=300413 RepID=UPI00214F153B|nr:muscle M-line assembly protein unc-89 isoform X2 [Epinephelus moara]